MAEISIVDIDEVYVKINCETDLGYELREYFTFKVPGFQFTPQYKRRLWDGNIRLFNVNTQLIYKGLVKEIEKFCKDRSYTFDYTYDMNTNMDWMFEDLNLPHTPRDYQIDATVHALNNKRATLLSPTASGKSLIIYMIIRNLFEKGLVNRGLIVVPNISLVEQMYKDFESYSTMNGWSASDNIHKIHSGSTHTTEKPIIISTWQSIYKNDPTFFKTFDFVVGDECHLFKSKSLTSIMTGLTKAQYRIGTTGTLDGSKTHKLVLEGLFGPVNKVTTTKDLMDKNHIADFNVKCLLLKYPEEVCKSVKDLSYQDEIDFLISNEARNKVICNLANKLEGNTLILFNYVERHGDVLEKMMKEKVNKGRKVFYVHGKKDVEEREMVRSIVETESDAIIVASYGVFSTGINIKNLHNVIFASPSKSRIRNLQSIGRSLRKSTNKVSATLYDLADDLVHKKRENYTMKHFLERLKIYSDEQFSFKIYKLDLKG